MTYNQKVQKAVNDYHNGMTSIESAKANNINENTLLRALKKDKFKYFDSSIFNVDEMDCWIMPTSAVNYSTFKN